MRQNRWPVSNLIVIGEKVEIEGAGRIRLARTRPKTRSMECKILSKACGE